MKYVKNFEVKYVKNFEVKYVKNFEVKYVKVKVWSPKVSETHINFLCLK